eukprot:g15604.t1
MIRSLLRRGAAKDTLNGGGCTALYTAAKFGCLHATEALLAAGVDTEIQCDEEAQMALHVAAEEGHVHVLRALIEHGADVNVCASDEDTALHSSSYYGKVEAIDMLVGAGAKVQARDQYGRTPLLDAAVESLHQAVLALLKHGADVNVRANGGKVTVLHDAAYHAGREGTAETVDILLRWGADETTTNDDGFTPAEIAEDYFGLEYDELAEDFERVHKLLANAPADRAWRRRGYLTMCRAHPDRLWRREINYPDAGMTPRSRSRGKPATAGASSGVGGGGGGTVDEGRVCAAGWRKWQGC